MRRARRRRNLRSMLRSCRDNGSLPARLNDCYCDAGDECAARACEKVVNLAAAIWQEPLEQFGSSGQRDGKEYDQSNRSNIPISDECQACEHHEVHYLVEPCVVFAGQPAGDGGKE